jgi:tetratricopeptide (TPR) repeat protein
MASMIPGYEYDIFISYRQKDNKGDRWVSEFVEDLKTELESTFKEEISVYFDINPHDGLLETHDVDASLKDKLKCLVFIPIISRTYCDPKSFAWEHEFKAFVEQASKDQFGLKVKLPGGNVASRVLPVQIHDLDADDKNLIETELGGFIRGIEFIYKEPGANKPLTSDDDENKNLNKTRYKIQLNKVAIAIKEIILGLKAKPVQMGKTIPVFTEPVEDIKNVIDLKSNEKAIRLSKVKILSGSIVLIALLLIVVILAYSRIFKRDPIEKLRSSGERISIVVMPFKNLTNDSIRWNIYEEIIQNSLTSYLSNFPEQLQVRQVEYVSGILKSKGITKNASITTPIASKISTQLDADVFIYGNIVKSGDIIRISAQLIDTKTQEIIKSFQKEGPSNGKYILNKIDSLSIIIKNYLIVSKLEKEIGKEASSDIVFKGVTNSPEAFKYFIYGNNAFQNDNDMSTAGNWYLKAIEKDSDFIPAINFLTATYYNQGNFDQAKKWTLKLVEKRDKMSTLQQLMTSASYALLFETPEETIKYIQQILKIDDQQPITYFMLGSNYLDLYQFDKAIPEFEKALEIYDNWGSKSYWVYNYTTLGYAYHKMNLYDKERKLYKKAEKEFPNDPSIIYRQAVLALSETDTIVAKGYIEKVTSDWRRNSLSEADISARLGNIYYEAGNLGKAEKCFRQAFLLEQTNPDRLNYLAYFLINNDRNINEGIELVDKALIISPDNYEYLDTKGWGLYKQSKFNESIESLQRSWDLRRRNAIYNHEAFLHLEAAKKSVENQKVH